ncbi:MULTISPECIES: chemotaxis protein CheW [unclassified Thioalkalivibrio]|uniref:chemotaxis protein CheW n=1 Tax=unclassified Thioalkalivibrio TaxID=2621013 RepID=UPI0003709CD7|nr:MULTISPECIES: chemotaxis protein CheW [unclassified Thioalkalivibrio]PYG03451.1 purine-binding chemotaxis protein CheW [Thioalkalivibrio sp. ALE21]
MANDATQSIQDPATAGEDQYLTFILADEEYGVDILRVQEIKGWERPTPLPNTPDYIRGVINVRGMIVPIIDMRLRFGMEPLEYGPTTVVIMLRVISEDRERVMGIVVDAVSEVYSIGDDNLQPAPDFGTRIGIDFVRGLATVEEKMILVLDIDTLLGPGLIASEDAIREEQGA